MNNSYVRKFDNLDEMVHFLENHKSPKLTQDAIYNPSCPVIINEMEILVKSLPQKKSPSPEGVSLMSSPAYLKKNNTDFRRGRTDS